VRVRRPAALAGVATVAALMPALPAFAHGAPVSPISRSAACAAGGGTKTGTAACKAARAANGGPFGTFDNVRVPNVDGADRKVVPDGKLCSGGLAAFKGLDIARDDFPATSVKAGRTLTVQYRTTAPHRGSFRIYLTRQGYDPKKKLTWDDLGSKPIATVTNPPIRDGAYVMSAKLPTGRTGRHMLYIVWQTSSTPDTYYSCSDLVFGAAAPAAAPTASAKPVPSRSTAVAKAKATRSAAPATRSAEPAAVATAAPAATTEPPAPQPQSLTPVGDESRVTLGHQIVAGALVVAFGVTAWAGIGRLRRRRFENR
jgi:predicted carbohydrate-binding protein with CBM5 and CBM33 domain